MTKDNKATNEILGEIDLRVEGYEFKTEPKEDNFSAILEAARTAENILYCGINGALQLDLRNLWGQSNLDLKYPEVYQEGKDLQSQWRCHKWMIPFEAYVMGLEWRPFDQMQKFRVKCETREIESKQVGIIKMNAFVPEEYRITGHNRTGCLIDIVNRYKDRLITAKTATIRVPVANLKESLLRCGLAETFDTKIRLYGFGLPGDKEVIQFQDINIEDRCRDAAYRDR